MAVLAVLIVEICLCLSDQEFRAHIAIAFESVSSKVPKLNTKRVTDPMVVSIAWDSWMGAVVMLSGLPTVHLGLQQMQRPPGRKRSGGAQFCLLSLSPLRLAPSFSCRLEV